jgi:hypothetical protein
MTQVYIPYWEWEDWHAGMWANKDINRLQEAIDFTGDHVRYGAAMQEVIDAWPRTMLNSLTNQSINKRAFLGHCAVCFKTGISEATTRAAWKQLSDQQRSDADAVAQKTINEWTDEYKKRNPTVHKNMGAAMLF